MGREIDERWCSDAMRTPDLGIIAAGCFFPLISCITLPISALPGRFVRSPLATISSRRRASDAPEIAPRFLTDLGRGMVVTSVGSSVATDLGFSPARVPSDCLRHLRIAADANGGKKVDFAIAL